MIKNKKIKIIDLFAGVGGLTYGFYRNENFDVIAANEILPDMAKAYSMNHPDVKMYCEDIKNFTFNKLSKDLNLKRNDVDVIIGGPPCQAYSTIGKRNKNDPRAKLFREYYRVLKEFKPKVFIFENVSGLLSMDNGDLIKIIISQFESLGYKIKYKLLNAVNYGTPQYRERIIIVGNKLRSEYHYPIPTHGQGLKKFITLGAAISDLPFTQPGESDKKYRTVPTNDYQLAMRLNASNVLEEQSVSKNNSKLIALMKALPEGGTPKDVPKKLRPISGYGNTYSKL
jgi:DNA (cytosine-5)-methyltransferase 1